MKIIDYKHIEDRQASGLSEKIRCAIKEGWVLYMGIFRDEDNWFVQAIVKYENN